MTSGATPARIGDQKSTVRLTASSRFPPFDF